MNVKRAAVMLALLCAPSLAHADPAQDHYATGRDSYRAGLYGRALEEFERSYAALPSPNTHLYIARSLRELGRLEGAREQYRATIHEAEERGAKYASARDAAEAELRDVEVRLDRAEPKSAAPTERPAPPPPASVAIVETPPPARVAPSALTWTSAGIGVAGLASFGVLYALASERHGYLEDHCTQARTASCDDALSAGRMEESAAYVALGVGIVAAAVAVVSFVVAPSDDGKARAARPWPLAF